MVERRATVDRLRHVVPVPGPVSGSAKRYDAASIQGRAMTTATQKRNQRIWATIRDIPRGSVASYGQIAEMAGIPRGARQVGYALRHLPPGHDVPWHRVITASGRIAFSADSDAFDKQVSRLLLEDVPVTNGRVDMRRFRWQPDLDELLWKPNRRWDADTPENIP